MRKAINIQFPFMESTYNVPSIEEISFKLTQNMIPSTTNIHHNRLLDDSLDYTLSKPSIQNMLYQDQEPSSLPPQLGQETFWKQSSLKTTCTGTTEPSTIKKPSKTFFRQRIVSSNKCNQKQSIKRRLSHHVMSIGEEIVEQKLNGVPLHSPHPAPYRLKQNKKNIVSGKAIKLAGKVKELELFELHTSMKVKPVSLQVHTARQKNYMRRVMQNRGSVIHAVDELSRCGTMETNRKNFRIH